MNFATLRNRWSSKKVAGLGAALVGLSGCGLEALLAGNLGPDHELIVSHVRGSTDPRVTSVRLVNPDGAEVTAIKVELEAGSFDLTLPSSDYANGRIVAEAGELRLEAFVPTVPVGGTADGVVVDVESTTSVLAIDAHLSATGRGLALVDPKVLRYQLGVLDEAYLVLGPPKLLTDMVSRIVGAADVSGATRLLKAPAFDAGFAAESSTIDLAWLAAEGLDYTGDGAADTSSVAFDRTLGEVAASLSLEGCRDPDNLRVVFEVDFNDGKKDGNCDVIDRFKWVKDEPGKQMYFVGGFHMESAIQDPELDAALGNTGGWVPNQIKMYDDGTNGDAAAGDNVWTIAFVLPKGARIGYKYTWGKQGGLWTGSEEWPGNQHILEIVDVNGDGVVYRHDNFGDEATNKDKSNLNRRGRGVVTWDTDVNGDGVPDARERMLDLDGDCTLDEWVTPAGIGPATVDCEG